VPATTGAPLPPWTAYDESKNAGVDAFFAVVTSAFLSNIDDVIPKKNSLKLPVSDASTGELLFKDAMFNPPLYTAKDIAPVLRGAAQVRQCATDVAFADALRNHYGGDVQPGAAPTADNRGIDAAAAALARSRDIGTPLYNAMRALHGLAEKATFADVTSDVATQTALQTIYSTVAACEALVCGLAEDNGVWGVGELFTAAIREQMTRTRDGDRFYFENAATSLSGADRAAAKRTSLADVIMRNTNIELLPCASLLHSQLFDCGTYPVPPRQTPSARAYYALDGRVTLQVFGASECSCDVHLCSLLCCSVGGASALVTFICVLCTLRTQISQSICNSVSAVARVAGRRRER
jgi:hypothetical protein